MARQQCSNEKYFRDCYGTTGLPLGYVICSDEAVKALADDLATGYDNPFDELIARAPIANADDADVYNPVYINDHAKVGHC